MITAYAARFGSNPGGKSPSLTESRRNHHLWKMDVKFSEVVERFKAQAELTADELRDFQFSNLNDVLTTLAAVQERQAKTGRLVFMKRLDPFLKTMTEYGKVIEVFVNSSDMLAFVWGPLKYLLLVASNFSDAFDSLLDTYQQIGEQIPLLESYKDLFSDHALRYFRQKLWKQLFKSNWKGFTSEISLLKENLRRHKHLIEGRASLIEFETIQNLRTSSQAYFRETREAEIRRRRIAVLQWLASPNVEAIHERHVKARSSNPEACRWMLQDSRFQQWYDPLYCSTPLLWINGKPGAGKSVMASMIIEEARRLKNVSIVFFYLGYRDPERNGFLPLARAFLSQSLSQNDSLLLHFEEKMSTASSHAVLSNLALAQELLHTALKSRKTFIILDGIDECVRDERKEICGWFRSVVDSLPRTKHDEIRCLFISQDDGIARKDLSIVPVISIKSDQNKSDIATFSRSWQDRIERKFGSLKELGLNLTEIVTARSKGIFIFAKCVLEELYQQPSKDSLLREWRADTFPSELNEVYDRILRRLMDDQVKQRRAITKKLLSWISLSKRPLRWFEIQAAVSIDLEEETINEIHSDQTVELVHSTVRDFLVTEGTIQTSKVELELCLLSLAYLNFADFSPTAAAESTRQSLISGRFSFYEYAVACWVPHLMSWLSDYEPDVANMADLEETVEQFLDNHFSQQGAIGLISKTMHDKLRPLQDFDCYDALAQAVVWSRKQLLLEKSSSDNTHALDFPDVTNHLRSNLEGIVKESPAAETKEALQLYYGNKWFKCPHICCLHFYHGFESLESRDSHVNRHDRPYTCTFDGCPSATFGCLSKKDLDKHMLESHGIFSEQAEYPNLTALTSESTRKHAATFKCERPFTCTECGKAFARKHDLKSHEKLHFETKPFTCRGTLPSGQQWGCGRNFARKFALMKHFESTAGRACTKLLGDQNMVVVMDSAGLSFRMDEDEMDIDTEIMPQYCTLSEIYKDSSESQPEASQPLPDLPLVYDPPLVEMDPDGGVESETSIFDA
ncbi:hypothetical protein FDECE_9442 [Fusarium decemcellulare]|nr:hypothetical protein FDECE_9442 [Fusarium decemcellulare]